MVHSSLYEKIKFTGSFGIAYLGKNNQVVGKYIMPEIFEKDKVGFGLHPKAFLNGDEIGVIKPGFSIKEQTISFLIELLPDVNLSGEYHCEFKINSLFSEKVGNLYKLDSVILEEIHVSQKVDKEN